MTVGELKKFLEDKADDMYVVADADGHGWWNIEGAEAFNQNQLFDNENKKDIEVVSLKTTFTH